MKLVTPLSVDVGSPLVQTDLQLVRGDTRPIVLTITNSAVAFDVSGWDEWFLTVDPSRDPTDDLRNVAQLEGVYDVEMEGVIFTPDATVSAGSYWYDIQGKDEDGSINTVARGRFILKQDITKNT